MSSHLFTTDDDQSTATTNRPQSDTFDFGLLFRGVIVTFGIVGILANGLVISILASSKELNKNKLFNVLLVNQMSFDLYSSVMLVITFFFKIFPVRLKGAVGYWLCVLIYGETILWFGLNGSMLNLAAITVERYVKIVFSTWYKKRFRAWMAYCTVAFTWLTAAAINISVSFPTSAVVKGRCWSWSIWPNDAAKVSYAVLYFIFYFFNLVAIFIYCYSRILLVVRRQARVMQGHQQQQPSCSTAAQTSQSMQLKMQANVMKTVISLTLFFVVCWTPNNVYYLLQNVARVPFNYPAYYVTVSMALVNVCGNPFIYATKYEVVKNKLKKLITRVLVSSTVSIQTGRDN